MDAPSPDDFWNLLAASRLVDASVAADLRRDYEAQTPPQADGPAATVALAQWLVARGALTLWQARRLARGDRGPYFVGDYRLLARLQSIGHSGLFRARHEPTGRVVQVVVLKPAACRDLAVWTAIVRRTTNAHQAADPLLSRTWALEQAGTNRFIVCEDIPDATLADELEAVGPLSVAEAAGLVLDLARAIAELHRLGEIHGAISLDMLRRTPAAANAPPRSGRVKLAQFPLSANPHEEFPRVPSDDQHQLEALGRRAAFIAPELMLPGRVCDARSDVYAIGCVFHALLTGQPPCWQGDAQRTLARAAFVGVPPLTPPAVPVEIATLIGYMTARDPAGRYPSAVEAADAIAACLGRGPVSTSLPPQRPLAAPPAASATAATPAPSSAIQASQPATASAAIRQPFAESTATFPGLAAAPSDSSRRATAPAHRSRLPLLIGVGLVAAVAIAAAVFFAGWRAASEPPRKTTVAKTPAARQRPPVTKEEVTESEEMTSSDEPPPPEAKSPETQRLIDDPTLPWGSPTSGPPPSLAYLPPGAQLILLARPAEIAADEEGLLFIKALGPAVEDALAAVQKTCGCGLDGIEMIQAGWQAAGTGGPAGGYAVHLREPADESAIRKAIGGRGEIAVGEETLHEGPATSCWLPRAEQGRVIVLGSSATLKDIIEAEAEAGAAANGLRAVLTPDMERLVGMLDSTRHLTLVAAPHYLFNDGRGVMVGPLAKLLDPLEEFCGGALRAAALSVHFGTDFYAELDAIATIDEPAKRMARRFGDQIVGLGAVVEEYCSRLDLAPYGRKLVMRLPAMIRILSDSTRAAAEEKAVVVNCYLPRHAGHNLALAAELALQQVPAAGGRTTTAAPPAGPLTADAALGKKMTLTFAKDTLEKSIQMIADEIGVPMEILGSDLQLEGITKNQSFGLEERDKTAEQILRVILAKANPDGKLVYVIRKVDGGERIDITTKAAAAKRGDTLPPAFDTPDGDAK